MDQNTVIVIDNGSYETKAGFAGQDSPSYSQPTAIPRPQQYGVKAQYLNKQIYFDRLDLKDLKYINFSYPIQSGIIQHSLEMEILWRHLFDKLHISKSEQHQFIFTESSKSKRDIRESMTKFVFEEFKASKFQVVNQAVLSLFASGRTTGIVLQSGDGVSETVPIYEGYALKPAVLNSDFTGRACTQYFADYICSLGRSYVTAFEMEIARQIKEQFCYITLDYQQELLKYGVNSKYYELPDGYCIEVKNHRFQYPEIIFNPQIKQSEALGIHQILNNSIQKCDIDLRRELYSNIVISGGNTLFPGYSERFTKEFTPLAPENMKVNIDAPPKRDLSAWIGGSKLSQLSTIQEQQITKQDYDEYGVQIVQRKCF